MGENILFTNFRSDGTAITKPCRADRQYIKQLEKEAKAKGKKFNLNTLIKEGKFKPSVEIMNQNFFKEFANSWQDIYNKKFPHKKPLFKKEKTEDSEEKKDDGACGSNKDSAPVFATKDDIVQAVKDSIKPMVIEAVKECLGIKDDAKPEVTGGVVDSTINKEEVVTRDYSSFLE